MANEAIMVQQLEERLFEVTMADGSSGTDIAKGTILKLSDANLAAASSSDGDIFGGILSVDNVGGDGQTRYAVWTRGVFDCTLTNATVVVGDLLNIQGTNLLAKANVTTLPDFSEMMGSALQDGGTNEVIEVFINKR